MNVYVRRNVFDEEPNSSRTQLEGYPSEGTLRTNLTKCINEMVLESQPPHKIVNLLLSELAVENELTIRWEG